MTLKILEWIAKLCIAIAGALLVFLIVIFGWLVFGRYVLNNTPTWVEQASILIIAYITFLGAAVGIRENSHLSIDFIRDALPDKIRKSMALLSDACLVAFGVVMAVQGYKLVMSNLHRAIPMIDMSEAWRAAPLGVGGLLIALFALSNLLRRFISNLQDGA
jgi:TRAP-type C4-dicarboxylate transport system permease small subunit